MLSSVHCPFGGSLVPKRLYILSYLPGVIDGRSNMNCLVTNLTILDLSQAVHCMLKEPIDRLVGVGSKPPEKGLIGVNGAKQVFNFLLSRSETGKRESYGALFDCRIIS